MSNGVTDFSDSLFWQKIKALPAGSFCALLEAALTLYAILMEGSITATQTVAVVSALSYFVMPLDTIPDPVPFIGYTDDMALLLTTLHTFQSEVSPAIKAQVFDWLPCVCQQQVSNNDYED